MSYSSRVYRQRNPHSHDEGAEKPFFGKQHDSDAANPQQGFFQRKSKDGKAGDEMEKQADDVADKMVKDKTEKEEELNNQAIKDDTSKEKEELKS